MLICIEGCDGAGKNTQSKLLAEHLQPSVLFSFPRYNTPLGTLIRRHLTGGVSLDQDVPTNTTIIQHTIGGTTGPLLGRGRAPDDLLMFQCLATIDKYDAANGIRADLASNVHVVCDRYTQSALAYGIADGLDETWLRRIQSSLPVPDLNIFIDVSEEEALRRRPQLRDRYEKDREKQRRVRGIYRQIWVTGGPGRWVVIDGHQPVEAVHEAIWKEVALCTARR